MRRYKANSSCNLTCGPSNELVGRALFGTIWNALTSCAIFEFFSGLIIVGFFDNADKTARGSHTILQVSSAGGVPVRWFLENEPNPGEIVFPNCRDTVGEDQWYNISSFSRLLKLMAPVKERENSSYVVNYFMMQRSKLLRDRIHRK